MKKNSQTKANTFYNFQRLSYNHQGKIFNLNCHTEISPIAWITLKSSIQNKFARKVKRNLVSFKQIFVTYLSSLAFSLHITHFKQNGWFSNPEVSQNIDESNSWMTATAFSDPHIFIGWFTKSEVSNWRFKLSNCCSVILTIFFNIFIEGCSHH